MSQATNIIGKTVKATLKNIEQEVAGRAYRASNELRNASLHVLRGQRSGRVYRVPFTKKTYQASAPGEPPAVRTGKFRTSWNTNVRVEKAGGRYRAVSMIESNLRAKSKGGGSHLLGDILEHGSTRMLPRPYKKAVVSRAMPAVQALYKRPYKV